MFTAKDVMALRERTGAGMMDCKKALTACEGDAEKAVDFLREKGLAAAAKKAGRIAAEGIVGAYTSEDGTVGVIVEVNCETDFVAKTDDFTALVTAIARQVAAKNPATVEELLEQTFVDDESETINAMLNAAVAKIGEKISIRRFARAEGVVDTYVHLGGKIGVLVNVEGEADRAAMHDVSMQIAAARRTPGRCRKRVHRRLAIACRESPECLSAASAMASASSNGRLAKQSKTVRQNDVTRSPPASHAASPLISWLTMRGVLGVRLPRSCIT